MGFPGEVIRPARLVRFVPTPDCARVASRKFDGLRVPNFNLASTFANWDPNFVELLRVQSVGGNYSSEGLK